MVSGTNIEQGSTVLFLESSGTPRINHVQLLEVNTPAIIVQVISGTTVLCIIMSSVTCTEPPT